jgi:hypothetical protein
MAMNGKNNYKKINNMKKLTYITLLLAAFTIYGCSEDPIDRRLPASEFFVTFETHNGVNKTLTITEGDTTVITITIAATVGNPAAVDFALAVPSSAPASAQAYELLDMDDAPLTVRSLTFPQGTGAQSFKFVSIDNDYVDGSRTFTFSLQGVSEDYRLGVDTTGGEGYNLPVVVKDDEVVILMSELVGEWDLTEDLYYSSAYHSEEYKITMEEVDPTTVRIIGFTDDEDLKVLATVNLTQKVKTMVIPAQDVYAWQPPYITHFAALNSTTFANNIGSPAGDFKRLLINKDDDGTLRINVVADSAPFSYVFIALDPDTRAYAGTWGVYARNTKLVKHP